MTLILPTFNTTSFVIRNISSKDVNILGFKIRPRQEADLFTRITGLTEAQVIEACRAPNGDLYRETVVKRSIEILSGRLGSFRYDPDGVYNSMDIGEILHVNNEEGLILDTTQYTDLRISTGSLSPVGAGNDPIKLAYKTGLVYQFDTNEEMLFTTQLPHGYKEGTDLHPHIHWTPHSRGVVEAGHTVAWRLELSVANVNGIFPDPTTYDLTATCDGTNDKHQVQGTSVPLDGTGLKVSAMILGRVYRAPGDTWVLNTASNRPGLLEVDFHYEIDTFGSRQQYIK